MKISKEKIRIAELEGENARLRQEVSELREEVKILREEIEMLKQELYGRSSEKRVIAEYDEINVFNEAEAESDADEVEELHVSKRKKVKGKREADLSGLPVEQIIHEVPEGERICSECGSSLHACSHDVIRRELTVIPAQYKVTEHVQTVYSCRRCETNAERVPMVKASVPNPVIRGSGLASASLVASIANQKYTLAVPLYRQEQELHRNEINLNRRTMANWLMYTSERWLSIVYEKLKAELLSGSVIHADETTVQVLNEAGKTSESKSYMWMYRSGCDTEKQVVLYEYKPNRKYENPKIFLEGFRGYVHADGYEAYHNLPEEMVVTGCWAHVRRKYTDIVKSLPEYNRKGSSATRAVKYCDRLFELEREYLKLSSDDRYRARYEARLRESKPVMDEFFKWVSEQRDPPKTPMGKANAYIMNEKKWLENVLRDGRLELSNNRAERSIKPFVIGRKNWLFSVTGEGASASAMYYSVIETAKENGLKPYEYLKYILETAPNLNLTKSMVSAEVLLPWNAPEVCRCER